MAGKSTVSGSANRKLVVHLKGGLGNQMFQYAAGRALALRSGRELYLDTVTGFVRDKIYKRQYALGGLPIQASVAGSLDRLPFWYERARRKSLRQYPSFANRRPWGVYFFEYQKAYLHIPIELHGNCTVWMDGAWQCESYFQGYELDIFDELFPPRPIAPHFLQMAEKMKNCYSVAVGVRVYEEVPGDSKNGVGGLTPLAFFSAAAAQIPNGATKPVFFVFCTQHTPDLDSLSLPGKVILVTYNEGYHGQYERLWLMSQCRHHIISNSSYYWWAAWLAERSRPGTVIVASDRFINSNSIPNRWVTLLA